jgi:hypothetical protein
MFTFIYFQVKNLKLELMNHLILKYFYYYFLGFIKKLITKKQISNDHINWFVTMLIKLLLIQNVNYQDDKYIDMITNNSLILTYHINISINMINNMVIS